MPTSRYSELHMPKPGPKARLPQERRRNRLQVNLTDEEWDQLAGVASGADSVALYVRDLILRHLAAKRRKR